MRTIYPQVAGIYESNHDSHSFLLVPFTNPDAEWFAADAYPCDRYGKKTAGFEYLIPFLAKDFGNAVE
ncbi:MAG: hypothetical protein WCI06_03365 [Methylococcaceae bacterium]